ncbi:hypothetical protein D3C81_969840 [compost metagenome]
MRDQKAQVLQALVDLRGCSGKQQYDTGEKHQDGQYRRRQSRRGPDSLTGKDEAPCLAGQQ